jgi:hypothetical protein
MPGIFLVLLIPIEYDLGDLMNYYVTNDVKQFSLSGFRESNLELKFYLLDRWFTSSDGSFRFSPLLISLPIFYLIGHVISAISSSFLERWIVNQWLGYPSVNLLQDKELNWFQKFFFAKYLSPFDDGFIEKFNKVVADRFGKNISKENKFWLCFTDIAQNEPSGYRRVMHFLNLYSFSRNISMCFFLYFILRVGIMWLVVGSSLNGFNWIILTAIFFGGLLMFGNYLKLFRMQCVELYFHFYTRHNLESSLLNQKE